MVQKIKGMMLCISRQLRRETYIKKRSLGESWDAFSIGNVTERTYGTYSNYR